MTDHPAKEEFPRVSAYRRFYFGEKWDAPSHDDAEQTWFYVVFKFDVDPAWLPYLPAVA